MTSFDNAQAMHEGWAISEVGAKGDMYRLEKLDDAGIFLIDQDAWMFVGRQALKGSIYHIRALKFLEANNCQDFELIENHVCLYESAMSLSEMFVHLPKANKISRYKITAWNNVTNVRMDLFTWNGTVEAGIMDAEMRAIAFRMDKNLQDYQAEEIAK